jgi:hypothetical protein
VTRAPPLPIRSVGCPWLGAANRSTAHLQASPIGRQESLRPPLRRLAGEHRTRLNERHPPLSRPTPRVARRLGPSAATPVDPAGPMTRRPSGHVETSGVRFGVRHGTRDAACDRLIADLTEASEEFRGYWEAVKVIPLRSTRKTLDHHRAGRLDVQCDFVLRSSTGRRRLGTAVGQSGQQLSCPTSMPRTRAGLHIRAGRPGSRQPHHPERRQAVRSSRQRDGGESGI